jgi:hypothetical protein
MRERTPSNGSDYKKDQSMTISIESVFRSHGRMKDGDLALWVSPELRKLDNGPRRSVECLFGSTGDYSFVDMTRYIQEY